MNLHDDLMKVKIEHGCGQCCRKKCRYGNGGSACDKFYPENSAEFMEYVLGELRKNITPSREKRLKRHAVSDGKSYNDGVATLDEYYVMMINSVLAEIRAGRCDYVFNFGQICDIMRFEPDIKVTYIAEAASYKIEKRG